MGRLHMIGPGSDKKIHGPCAITGCEYLCTWFAYVNNIDVQIVVPPPKFCCTFECYALLFALAFMDCSFQWEISFQQITRQELVQS